MSSLNNTPNKHVDNTVVRSVRRHRRDGEMNELALFAGAGGGILGGKLLGWRTVCAVEWEAYAASVLCARQNDGALPAFPIWDDVRTFDGRPWRGIVDVVSGGFPCQDISAAGKGAGIEGERSGMWTEMARIIGEVRPRFAFVENSPMLTSRGLGRVLGDLAALGYDARWGVLGAVDAGAPHKRDRIWIVADAVPAGEWRELRQSQVEGDALADATRTRPSLTGAECAEERPYAQSIYARRKGDVADANSASHRRLPIRKKSKIAIVGSTSKNIDGICDTASAGLPNGAREPLGQPGQDAQPERPDRQVADAYEVGFSESAHLKKLGRNRFSISNNAGRGNEWEHTTEKWWATEPDVGRVAHGVAARVDRLKAIGNGQVPAVAALAWEMLTA